MPNNDIIAKLLGDWSKGVSVGAVALKLALCVVLAAVIGTERAQKHHAAGLRTFISVSLALAVAAIGDTYLIGSCGVKVPVLTAATVIGVAIIGCNTILFSSKNQLKGLTTSVCLWANGIISAMIGFGQYTLALIGFVALVLCVALFPNFERRFRQRSPRMEVHLELKSRNCLPEFMETVRKFGLKINDIEPNPAYANSGLGVYSVLMTATSSELKKKKHGEIIEALAVLENVSYIEEIG